MSRAPLAPIVGLVVATQCARCLAQQTPAAETPSAAATPATSPTPPAHLDTTPTSASPGQAQAEREEAFSKLLSGATLEGNFSATAGGKVPDKLKTDKYTLGNVRKFNGNTWVFEAKMSYGEENSAMIPLLLPVEWAGDTPVIVVDNVTIPGMGTYSARVMFFDSHYMGYWKHGERGGHMFGLVRPAKAEAETAKDRAAAPK